MASLELDERDVFDLINDAHNNWSWRAFGIEMLGG